jgi:hypothetical protein
MGRRTNLVKMWDKKITSMKAFMALKRECEKHYIYQVYPCQSRISKRIVDKIEVLDGFCVSRIKRQHSFYKREVVHYIIRWRNNKKPIITGFQVCGKCNGFH